MRGQMLLPFALSLLAAGLVGVRPDARPTLQLDASLLQRPLAPGTPVVLLLYRGERELTRFPIPLLTQLQQAAARGALQLATENLLCAPEELCFAPTPSPATSPEALFGQVSYAATTHGTQLRAHLPAALRTPVLLRGHRDAQNRLSGQLWFLEDLPDFPRP